MGAAESALADCPEYRIYEISDADLIPDDVRRINALGINNLGEIVGVVNDPRLSPILGTEDGAFYWQPSDRRSDYAVGFNILPVPSNFRSRANEINDSGYAVGARQVSSSDTSLAAFRWNVATSSDNALLGLGSGSEAFAVNDETPRPLIVGDYVPSGMVQHAFRIEPDGTGLDRLDAGIETTWLTFGRDISNPVAGDAITVGWSQESSLGCVDYLLTCVDGWAWEETLAIGLNPIEDLALDPDDWSLAQGYGVNDVGNSVGISLEEIGVFTGRQRATYWETTTDDVVILPGDPSAPGGSSGDEGPLARAIADPIVDGATSTLIAVGFSDFTEQALRWTATVADDEQGDWTVEELICLIGCDLDPADPCDADESRWEALVFANDINDQGWIVGQGLVRDTNQGGSIDARLRGFLLVPTDWCPGDIAGAGAFPDGTVDTRDLLALLAAWGDTSDCPSNLPADINCDGEVASADLLALLASWGQCDGFSGDPTPDSLSQELIDAGLDTGDWDDFLDVMAGTDEQQKARYLCWMNAYLTQCTNCPPCSGSDPFD